MKIIFRDTKFGLMTYEESFWTGKKKLYYSNGSPVEQINKNSFLIKTKTQDLVANINGNYFLGITMNTQLGTTTILSSVSWYVYVFSAIMFALVLICGNSQKLFDKIPIVGGVLGRTFSVETDGAISPALCGAIFGAIGGIVGALFAMLNIAVSRSTKNHIVRIVMCVALTIGTIAFCYLLAFVLAKIFIPHYKF